MLALEALPAADKHVYAVGLADDEAEQLARELLTKTHDADERYLVVEVQSQRRRYGRLCAVSPVGRFFPQERVVLQAYGRLVAAALDSATAVEEARRPGADRRAHCSSCRTRWPTSAPPTRWPRTSRARVTAVVGCDRAAVILFEPDAEHRPRRRDPRLPGGPTRSRLHAMEVPVAQIRVGRRRASPCGTAPGRRPRHAVAPDDELGSAAVATIPIVINGDPVGLVVGDVVDRPERLCDDPELPGRLRGVASQATIAIRNARLLESIRHQALHDALTGLPNRTLILDRVEQMLARARRRDAECAALFIDLDGFKQVNDTLGHEAGDRLLQRGRGPAVGDAARERHDRAARRRRVRRARRRRRAHRQPGARRRAAARGAARAVRHRRRPAQRRADHREHRHRVRQHASRPATCCATPTSRCTRRRPRARTATSRSSARCRPRSRTGSRSSSTCAAALDRDEFFLVYQPIFDLDSGRVLGVEALLRWKHPVRGVVQPDAFIPLLEETKPDRRRRALGARARRAARPHEWHLADRDMYVSVNVSARQLDDQQLVGDIRARARRRPGSTPSALVIEITETAIMRDADAHRAPARRSIKALGVGVAIDDFGTGYSSLAYLRQFPVDILKIDRSFVTPISDSSESKVLLHTLVQLGKQLGLKTLAEGIEQHEQFCQLQDEHCDSGQGFMFARPLAADAVEEFLASLPNRADAADAQHTQLNTPARPAESRDRKTRGSRYRVRMELAR